MAERAKTLSVLACALRLCIAALFVYAGAVKAADPTRFAESVDHYRMLPYFAVAPLALYLPWLEIVCGLAAGFGLVPRGALGLLLAMSVVFTVAVGSAWGRGLDIDCGCFGAAHAGPIYRAFARDVLLCGVLFWLWRREVAREKTRSYLPGRDNG